METNKKNRYKELDALRGIAALLVVFFHFTMGSKGYNQIFKLGTTGVDLFFIISGFVIFMSLQKISSGAHFVINRVSRLYPTYWASVTFTFIVMVYSLHKGNFHFTDIFIKFVGNLTMFQFYLNIPDLDRPYWTMIIEMLFYISIFTLFQFKQLKYLNVIGVVVCAVTAASVHYFYDINFVKLTLKYIPLFQFIPLFFAGTVFYKLYSTSTNRFSNYIIIVFCLLCQATLFPLAGRSRGFISWPEYNTMLTLYFTLFVLFVNSKLTCIVNDVTLFFGKISFALYLTHQYISLALIIPFFHTKLGINFWVVVLFINLPIVTAIASFITYKIEIPYSKKMKERFWKINQQLQ